ncbi:hypothetical protein FDB52_12045 [Clostridium botulinum]|nr:hypothetical protein [Clostridium botulinum]NFN49264.1 hypothetical protein [Clostridium botulinum]
MKESRIVKGMNMALQTEEGTMVYVAKTYNKGNLRHGFKIVVLDKNLYCSDVLRFSREDDIFNKIRKLVNVADLTMKDINKVVKYISENFDEINTIHSAERMNIREVFKVLYDEVKESEVKNECYFINTKIFSEIIKGCGWSGLEVKKILLESKMLQVSKGRHYDFGVKNQGTNVWYMCINALALKEESDGVEVE